MIITLCVLGITGNNTIFYIFIQVFFRYLLFLNMKINFYFSFLDFELKKNTSNNKLQPRPTKAWTAMRLIYANQNS